MAHSYPVIPNELNRENEVEDTALHQGDKNKPGHCSRSFGSSCDTPDALTTHLNNLNDTQMATISQSIFVKKAHGRKEWDDMAQKNLRFLGAV